MNRAGSSSRWLALLGTVGDESLDANRGNTARPEWWTKMADALFARGLTYENFY